MTDARCPSVNRCTPSCVSASISTCTLLPQYIRSPSSYIRDPGRDAGSRTCGVTIVDGCLATVVCGHSNAVVVPEPAVGVGMTPLRCGNTCCGASGAAPLGRSTYIHPGDSVGPGSVLVTSTFLPTGRSWAYCWRNVRNRRFPIKQIPVQ